MKIVIAPDSFKGSLSAAQVCAAIAIGAKRAIPEAEIVSVPMADGGEGTMQSLIDGFGGEIITCEVRDPLGREITAEYGITTDGTAVMEMAQASGLLLLSQKERDPLLTSTYGTGELIKNALDLGARDFIIGIGGSATNDGGVGMAQALGYRFYDKKGGLISFDGGGRLLELGRIDNTYADERIKESRFTVACDVDNPLLGKNGASYIYGPQKGATPEKAEILDKALTRFAVCVEKDLGLAVADIPGAGAAGGLGAGSIAFLGAELKKGVKIVIEATDLERKLEGAALVITGEGRTDEQTLKGKTVLGVISLAKKHDIPAIVISGSLADGAEKLFDFGATGLYSIMKDGMTVEEAITNAAKLLEELSEQWIKQWTVKKHQKR